MAIILPITLSLKQDVANMDVQATYQVCGSSFDVASGQPYREECKLIGDDTIFLSPEDFVDDQILDGLLHTGTVVFTNTNPINRVWTKTLPKLNFDEDNPAAPPAGTDEIRAVVTLTPLPASAVTRESNIFAGTF